MSKPQKRSLRKNNSLDLTDPSIVFTTYDLGISSALLCLGYELLHVNKTNPQKALFIFRKTKGIEEVSGQYFSDQLSVKARSFFDSIKALKNRLYSR